MWNACCTFRCNLKSVTTNKYHWEWKFIGVKSNAFLHEVKKLVYVTTEKISRQNLFRKLMWQAGKTKSAAADGWHSELLSGIHNLRAREELQSIGYKFWDLWIRVTFILCYCSLLVIDMYDRKKYPANSWTFN